MASPQLLALQPPKASPSAEEDKTAGIIRRRSAQELDYNEFYWQYMQANWPVILTNVSNAWECRRSWTTTTTKSADKDNENANADAKTDADTAHINFDYLRSRIGDCLVPVADCNATYFNSHAKLELKFFDFLARWQRSIAKAKEGELNSNNLTMADDETTTQLDNLYLKDWHLAAELPTYDFYRVPKHFASDWLNEQLITLKRDDYRFVYMGPRNSWTSYHSDVFGSYSWSTNIIGHKKWLIMPPGEELKLSDRLGNLPFSIDEQQLEEHKVRYFTIDQKANEAVFVPSGWFHQVWNQTDTISVNHNWFNACNAPLVWRNMQSNMRAVRREISDCQQMDNFEAHCQTMLRASFGINYLDFLELLEFIAARRVAAMASSVGQPSTLLFDSYRMNNYHMRYDLECMEKILPEMLEDETVQHSAKELHSRCLRLQQQLSHSLNGIMDNDDE